MNKAADANRNALRIPKAVGNSKQPSQNIVRRQSGRKVAP